jgi:hypothetical protein
VASQRIDRPEKQLTSTFRGGRRSIINHRRRSANALAKKTLIPPSNICANRHDPRFPFAIADATPEIKKSPWGPTRG